MSKTVHENLIELHYKLNHTKVSSPQAKQELTALAEKIEAQLELGKLTNHPDTNLVEEIGLAIGEFEQDYPTLSATLKNILFTLQNIGV